MEVDRNVTIVIAFTAAHRLVDTANDNLGRECWLAVSCKYLRMFPDDILIMMFNIPDKHQIML